MGFLLPRFFFPAQSSSTDWKHHVYLESFEQLYQDPAMDELRVILKLPEAGLGNRLTASVAALVLGMLLKRPVYIDGGSYRLGKLLLPLKIPWDADSLDMPRHPTIRWTDADVDKFLCMDFEKDVPVGSIELETGQYFLPHLKANPLYSAIFSIRARGPLGYSNLFGRLLKRYFAPVTHLQDQIDRNIAAMRTFAPSLVLGFHLRDIYHTSRNKQIQLECLIHLIESTSQNTAVFLASDSASWLKAIRTKLSEMAAQGLQVFSNTDLQQKDIGEDPQYSGKTAGLEGALVDLFVLGACDDLILSAGSTFSYVAQSLQGHPGVTVTRQGKCVRSLSSDPQSGRFPDLATQSCWNAQTMWGVSNDQLCADPLCPISCGGRYERAQGETTSWLKSTLQQQLAKLSPSERRQRESTAMRDAQSKRLAQKERPDFWKSST